MISMCSMYEGILFDELKPGDERIYIFSKETLPIKYQEIYDGNKDIFSFKITASVNPADVKQLNMETIKKITNLSNNITEPMLTGRYSGKWGIGEGTWYDKNRRDI